MTLFPITFSNFFPAFLSALFTAGSLYAMGRLLLGALGANRFGHHVALAIGFGINHLVFLSASLVMDGPAAVLFMNLLHAAFLGFYLMSRGRNALPTFRLEPLGTVLMLVVLLPYVFRLFSPPMNVDGLMFYLPNVEWVYHRGLAFNPHLTAYTTMPMAAEYLFAQAYGLAGIPAVVFTDALFCVLCISLVFRNARVLMPRMWASACLFAILLYPHSITYLFGSGKVDMVLVYLLFAAGSMLSHPLEPRRVTAVLALFFIACSVKYPVWLQLLVPSVAGLVYLLYRRQWRLSMLVCVLAISFLGPVMIKNAFQVGNPLAPIVYSPGQTRYLASSHTPDTWDRVWSPVSKGVEQGKSLVVALANFLEYSFSFILYAVFGVLMSISLILGIDVKKVEPLILFLLLILIPWHLYFLDDPQPPRFLLFPLMLLMTVNVYLASGITARMSSKREPFLGFSLAAVLLLGTLVNSYASHGRYLDSYRRVGDDSLRAWYESEGKHHYAASRRMFDEGWIDRKVMYLTPLAIGTIPFSRMGRLHTDADIMLNRTRFNERVGDFDYIFCALPDRKEWQLRDKEVVFQNAFYCLVKP
jgi:hypothetical protein